MGVKTITIKKKVYDKLSAVKNESESFSDLFERLVENEKPVLIKYKGILSKKEGKALEKEIENSREKFNKIFSKREKELDHTWGE